MIHFRCKNCNQKIRVPEIHVGKKGKCPKCKSIVVIPRIESTDSVTSQSDSSSSKISLKSFDLDSPVFDISRKVKTPGQTGRENDTSDKNFEEMYRYGADRLSDETEQTSKRQLPWLIDIFLYPANKASLAILAIIIGIPFLMHVLVKFLGLFSMVFPPMLVFLAFFAAARLIVGVVCIFYMYWYICECIRDSANGGIRAPETIGATPGIGELLWQFLKIVGCLAFFSLPGLVYFLHNREFDVVFWVLCACLIFFFPMGLLSVVIFNSLRGLNPILIVGSIFSTFLPYCGLIIFYYALGMLVPLTVYFLPKYWILNHAIKLISFYTAMVGAHLLGRFALRYQEKLNWDAL